MNFEKEAWEQQKRDARLRETKDFEGVRAVKRKDPSQDYGELLQSIKGELVTFDQLSDPTFDRPDKCFVIRHDVDKSIKQACAMAHVEKELGVRSTYFLLHSALYFQPYASFFVNSVHQILNLGHDVAIHNDAITMAIKLGDTPAYSGGPPGILRKAIAKLREIGVEVNGTACHGAGECYTHLYRNYEMFTEHDPKKNESGGMELPTYWKIPMADLGLKYEVYLTNRPDYYLSDSHGEWYGIFVSDQGCMPFEKTISLMTKDQMKSRRLAKEQDSIQPYLKTNYGRDIVTKFNKGWHTDGKWKPKPRVLQLLIHPLHWKFK